MADVRVESWEQLQERIGAILERINADDSLAVAAAANPLLALEELQYDIAPEVRPEIEFRLRFDRRTVVRLLELREQVAAAAGHPFAIDDRDALARVLFVELGLWPEGSDDAPAREPHAQRKSPRDGPAPDPDRPPLPDTAPRPVRVAWREQPPDPLEVLRDRHPIVEPLLAYRELESSRPRLAPPALYREIRAGKRHLPIGRVRGRLKASPEGPDGDTDAAPVDVNAADADALERLPGITRALAERIVAHRAAHGPFARAEDVRDVPGIGERLLARLLPHVRAGDRPD